MKLKTILLTTAILAGLFSSCSEESYVSPDIDGEDAILSLNLSVKEELVSKAGNNIDYVKPATGDEKSMSNYVIAVFDGENSDARIAFTAAKITATTQLAVNNIVVKGGTNRKVLIIANLPESDYTALVENGNTDNYATLSKFRAELKLIQKGAFQSNGLVKVLLKENVTLTKGTVNTLGTQSSPLQLIQLPARVDVKVGFNEEDKKQGASFQIKKFTVEGINTASDVILTDMTKVENKQPDTKSSINWEGEAVESFSFYTYEKLTSNNPVVIKITGILRENTLDTEGIEKSYTFTFDASNNLAGIIHGNLYEVAGTMNLNSKTISFEVKVKDWNSVLVDADIKDVHYLFVKEHEIIMSNIPAYSIDYASDLDVQITDLKSWYQEMKNKVLVDSEVSKGVIYNTNGQKITYKNKTITVTVGAGNKINISSDIPTNLAPLYITFSVKTKTGDLKEDITVIQYPSNYITGAGPFQLTSKWHFWSGGSYNTTISIQYIFMINVVTAFDGYRVGNPVENGYTKPDEEANKIISPKFVIASQNGASQLMKQYEAYSSKDNQSFTKNGKREKNGGTGDFPSAMDFCYNYSEGGYAAGTWRLPTLAELEYIRKLEYEYESATGLVLAGDEYWSAQTEYAYAFTTNVNNGKIGPYKPTTAHTRCVRDVY